MSALLEDPDGAPYPEAVQRLVGTIRRDALVAALESVAGPLREQIDRQANEWREETQQWQEWSNRLTEIIPEGEEARWSNPEGAQEQIIEDCYRAYRRQLDRARRLVDKFGMRGRWFSADEVVGELRAALEIEDD